MALPIRWHAVESISNLGLSILPARLILPGIFIIGCILSFAMGTSMGTVVALAPIAINIAQKTNCNMALICGAVVGGAMFGDNLSFISDTTIAATRTQGISMKAKFKANILIVLPAVFINLLLLGIQNIDTSNVSSESYQYQLINIVPYILVIALSLLGINVVKVMVLGILSGIFIGVIHGDFNLIDSCHVDWCLFGHCSGCPLW